MSLSERIITLIGEENYNILRGKTILVIGLGGVGGTALEALARSGVESFIVIDNDIVSSSNLNRQILYVNSDIGKRKVEAAADRLHSINPDIKVIVLDKFINENTISILDNYEFDFVVDAIDFIPGKLSIYKYCLKKNVLFISSLGMANRIDPTKVIVTTLDKTHDDPLAKKLRGVLVKEKMNPKDIKVVFSNEIPLKRCLTPSSMMMVPSSAGLAATYFVIQSLIKDI